MTYDLQSELFAPRTTAHPEVHRRKYDESFKKRAVKLLIESGRSVSDVARELDIERSILQKWKKKFHCEFETLPPHTSTSFVDVNEFIALKKELDTMRQTVDHLRTIIKKSLTSKYLDD